MRGRNLPQRPRRQQWETDHHAQRDHQQPNGLSAGGDWLARYEEQDTREAGRYDCPPKSNERRIKVVYREACHRQREAKNKHTEEAEYESPCFAAQARGLGDCCR